MLKMEIENRIYNVRKKERKVMAKRENKEEDIKSVNKGKISNEIEFEHEYTATIKNEDYNFKFIKPNRGLKFEILNMITPKFEGDTIDFMGVIDMLVVKTCVSSNSHILFEELELLDAIGTELLGEFQANSDEKYNLKKKK